MLLPTASVTLIGLIVGVAGYLMTRHRPAATLGIGVAGAWIGFLAGALVGVVIDLVLRDGVYVAIIGHVVAIAGAATALRWFRAGAASPRTRAR